MLIQLKLENIALIEIIEINFEKGLNIITGDSGSGKSLILDSLNVLFGGTNIPLKHLIRPGKQHCAIEAKFSSSFQINNWLISNGFKSSSSLLNIKRISYRKNNKVLSKYSLNNLSINKKLLEELGRLLIDFAGQSDTFIFDSQDKRRLIIDDLCSQESRHTSERIKSIWGETKVLEGLMHEKIEFSKNQTEKNLAIKHMLKSLEEADLNSSEEILELELLENKLVNNLEIKSGWKIKYLSQFESSPGSAIKDYWDLDETSLLIVADPRGGNLLNFNVGEAYFNFMPRLFWVELQTRFGNQYYVKDHGEDGAVLDAINSVEICLERGGCQVVPGLPKEQYIWTLCTSILGGLVAGFASAPRKEGQVISIGFLALLSPLW